MARTLPAKSYGISVHFSYADVLPGRGTLSDNAVASRLLAGSGSTIGSLSPSSRVQVSSATDWPIAGTIDASCVFVARKTVFLC